MTHFQYAKDPDATVTIWQNWSSKNATNDNGTGDTGYLLGRTISSVSIPSVTGLTVGTPAVNSGTETRQGVTYAANTLVSVQISGGTAGTEYDVTFRCTLSDSTIDDRTVTVKVVEK